MSKRIYVGNLSFDLHEQDVTELFEAYGKVSDVHMPIDRATGRPRGFAFVEMDEEAADAAIQALDGQEHGGRNLRVNEARPRTESHSRW
ncbi:MAG: RNA-binding protein [Acidobacteriota bacterium]